MSVPPTRRAARRPSRAVFVRRRIAVLVVLVLVVTAVTLLVMQPWRGSEDPAPVVTDTTAPPQPKATLTSPPPEGGPTPTSSETPAPTASATPALLPCSAKDVKVEALTDDGEYASGQNPKLSIRVTNTSPNDCQMNVGTAAQVFTITSGNDVWWRSTDCQADPSDAIVLLAKGQTVQSAAPLEWPRVRSSVNTCGNEDRPRALPGTYHLAVSIGGVASADSARFILH